MSDFSQDALASCLELCEERLAAAEKVIEAARKTLWECVTTDDGGTCLNHWHLLPCPVSALADAIDDYDKQTAR